MSELNIFAPASFENAGASIYKFASRVEIASAGSAGTSARLQSDGMTIVGVGRGRLPSKFGSHFCSASSSSDTSSRICLSVSTAPVSGSSAAACTTSSGSEYFSARNASVWTLMFVRFRAAHCGGRLPTYVGCSPEPSANIGSSDTQSSGRFVISRLLRRLPLNLTGGRARSPRLCTIRIRPSAAAV